MRKIERLPRFMPGQIIDISYKKGELPDRLLIKTVYMREEDDTWMYGVYSEKAHNIISLNQDFIRDNMTTKYTPVYKMPKIIKMYADGWRFCGNYPKDKAMALSGKYAINNNINNIIIRPALNSMGNPVDNEYGIWIRYNTTITDNGNMHDNLAKEDDIIVIK